MGSGFVCAMSAQDLDLAPLLPAWEHIANLRPRAGFKDNLLLAHTAPEESAFIGTGLELVLLRPLGAETQFEFVGTAEDRRYLASDLVQKEQTAVALAQLKKSWEPSWQGTLGLEYLYLDQILDVSVSETILEAVRVRGHTIAARPTLRHDIGLAWVEVQLPLERRWFREPIDDDWETGCKLSWGLPYGNQCELRLSYEYNRRWYDESEQRAADGAPLPGTEREFRQQEVWLSLRQHWDNARRWRTTTRVAGRLNEDNGSGYFDYVRGLIAQQIRYRGDQWELQAEARLTGYDYTLQTVSLTDLSRRKRSELLLGLRCERKIVKFLKIFADYSYEQTRSNRTTEQYAVNTVSGGLNWEF
jgi:hypothetical protein